MDDNLQQRLYEIADEMRGMASLQKHYAQNIYETERAHRVLELAAEIAALAEQKPVADMLTIFEDGPWNHFSPMLGAEAAVFNARQEILLIKRRDNARWALPGGLAEIGQTLAEAAVRELWEEAGLRGEAQRLLGIFDSRRWGTHAKLHLIHVIFLVDCPDLTPAPGIECLDAAYFARDALPEDLHPGHERRIPACFDALHGDLYFDPADSRHIEMHAFQRPDQQDG